MYNIIHDIRHDIIYKDAFHLLVCPAAVDPRLAQRVDETDDDREPDIPMDFDEEGNYADQGPLTDMDMEKDAEILSLLRPTPTI